MEDGEVMDCPSCGLTSPFLEGRCESCGARVPRRRIPPVLLSGLFLAVTGLILVLAY